MKPMYIKRKLLTLLFCCFAAVFCMNYHTGPGASGQFQTGAPFDGGTCASCHSGGSFTPSTTIQVLNGSTPVTSFVPGGSYTLRITITGGANYGFQIVCVDNASSNDYNGWGILPPNTHSLIHNARHYIEHTNTLTSGIINIPWTAPASGAVKFYACGNVVDGTGGSNNDNPAAASLIIGPCIPPTLTPSVTDVTCNGGSNGTATVTASGGGPFTYSWSGPSSYSATTQSITGLPAGTYSVAVTTSGGCTGNAIATVSQPTVIVTAHGSSNAPFCPGDTLKLVGTGTGVGTLSFSWAGPGGFSSALQNPVIPNATPAINGTYTVTVTDANGCSQSYNSSVVIYPSPVVNLGPDATICSGSPITLDAGNPGCVFVWNTGATTQTIVAATSGTFYATATNSFSCSSSDTIVVVTSSYVVPGITITTASDTVCNGSIVTFNAIPVNGGSTPTFQWRFYDQRTDWHKSK